ncbi:hypothetical protein POM88_006493 [Heracleum sosnowskyi]|uniref:Replication protein A 70 kDa DNA-binding subunit B/D first OB fold domain-containing protein n=1 Tax=Heracleum sosnowskyi TaxID=360622 RepID=A0AAD8N025_9APIA|nr:hypothetical protein POM88_006493 [Heracleum sosnowskyi]
MTTRNYHNLVDLCAGSYNWNIKVRVIRSWRGVSKQGEGFKGLNLLFLDNQDTRIHGFVPGNIIDKHEIKLLEGNICSISNFSVKDYKTEEKFRCINSDKQIIFTTYTDVKTFHEDDVLIAKNIFDFYDLGDLSDIANQNVFLTDVIGFIEKDLPLANLINKTSVNVTFWDSLAEEFEATLYVAQEFPIIIIIASAKITSWQGTNHSTPQFEISNVTATKFYMNYDYHDVANLKKMLRQPMFAKYNFTTQAEEKIETLYIAEIRNLGINYIEKEVICQIKVNTVVETIYWNFYQCPSCYKEIEPVQGLFKYYRCADRNVPHPYKKEARTILGIYAPTNNEETSGSGYHLDDFSELNFQSPDVKLKNKKKRSLGKKKK